MRVQEHKQDPTKMAPKKLISGRVLQEHAEYPHFQPRASWTPKASYPNLCGQQKPRQNQHRSYSRATPKTTTYKHEPIYNAARATIHPQTPPSYETKQKQPKEERGHSRCGRAGAAAAAAAGFAAAGLGTGGPPAPVPEVCLPASFPAADFQAAFPVTEHRVRTEPTHARGRGRQIRNRAR